MTDLKSETSSITRMQGMLDKGDFYTEVSSEVVVVLKDSIKIRRSLKGSKSRGKLTLDFKEVNKSAIEKRGNLKVYQDLPKGIRVIV